MVAAEGAELEQAAAGVDEPLRRLYKEHALHACAPSAGAMHVD